MTDEPMRISVDQLAEAVTTGMFRAVQRHVDLERLIGGDKPIILNPIIRYGGPIILAARQEQLRGMLSGGESEFGG